MDDLQILSQLLNGNPLGPQEMERAENIISRLRAELETRKPHTVEFTRINNDVNGNPRYVCHYTNIAEDYATALKLAKTIGGRKFHNKQYGGGIVFQSYNTKNLQQSILNLK